MVTPVAARSDELESTLHPFLSARPQWQGRWTAGVHQRRTAFLTVEKRPINRKEKSYLLHKAKCVQKALLARDQLDEIANICAHDPYDVYICISVSEVC